MITSFTVCRQGYKDLDIALNMPGKHNVQNALAAIAVATDLEVADEHIVSGLNDFAGVGRRFQVLGDYPAKKAQQPWLMTMATTQERFLSPLMRSEQVGLTVV